MLNKYSCTTILGERAGDSTNNRDPGPKKRSLEAMLAPPSSKRVALSPRQAKSPEEVEMYTSTSNSYPPVSHGPNAMYKSPGSNAYSGNNMYRLMNPNPYQQPPSSSLHPHSNNVFNTPNSPSKATNPSPRMGQQPGMANHQPTSAPGYMQQRNPATHNAYSRSLSAGRSSSTENADELVSTRRMWEGRFFHRNNHHK